MPIPKAVARLNKVGFNRVVKHVAPRLPGLGVIEHRGRRTGRSYRTPVNVFRTPSGFVVALTYGSDSDWVRNVLAAGECELATRGQRFRLVSPRVYRDATRRDMPAVVRPILGLVNVDEFLALTTAHR